MCTPEFSSMYVVNLVTKICYGSTDIFSKGCFFTDRVGTEAQLLCGRAESADESTAVHCRDAAASKPTQTTTTSSW